MPPPASPVPDGAFPDDAFARFVGRMNISTPPFFTEVARQAEAVKAMSLQAGRPQAAPRQAAPRQPAEPAVAAGLVLGMDWEGMGVTADEEFVRDVVRAMKSCMKRKAEPREREPESQEPESQEPKHQEPKHQEPKPQEHHHQPKPQAQVQAQGGEPKFTFGPSPTKPPPAFEFSEPATPLPPPAARAAPPSPADPFAGPAAPAFQFSLGRAETTPTKATPNGKVKRRTSPAKVDDVARAFGNVGIGEAKAKAAASFPPAPAAPAPSFPPQPSSFPAPITSAAP
ncbi:hypothetical protein TeGR_g12219, partial [Tetraparma gracilis]